MPKPGLRKIARYPNDFKVQAVKLSLHPDIQIKDVAQALDIHPFMLSRWRKEYREGKIMEEPGKQYRVKQKAVSDNQRIRTLERELEQFRIENDLLKKAIRFSSEKRKTSTSSLKRMVRNTR